LNFINQVKSKGLARSNRYEVVVPFPNAVRIAGVQQLANLFCEHVDLPGLSVASTPLRTFGETREVPYEKIYDNINLSFYVDADMNIKDAFEKWINIIFDPQSRTFGYYREYVRDIDVYVVSIQNNQPSYKVTLFEAYPKTLSPISLDTGNSDVMKMNVTIQYKYALSYGFRESQYSPSLLTSAPFQDRPNVTTGRGFGFGQNYNILGNPSRTVFDVPLSIIRDLI
jgi:hypothetical protein